MGLVFDLFTGVAWSEMTGMPLCGDCVRFVEVCG